MTDWATLADLGTARWNPGPGRRHVRGGRGLRSRTRIAERALLVGQRPVLAPDVPEGPAAKVQFAGGRTFPVGSGQALVQQDEGDHLAGDSGRAGQRRRARPKRRGQAPPGRPGARAADLRTAAARPADQYQQARFLAGRLRNPQTPLRKEIAQAIETRGRLTVDVLYGDHEGGQPSITRFVLLPEANSWRCDATRYWNLPAGRELDALGFS